jgi:hypothetical protein
MPVLTGKVGSLRVKLITYTHSREDLCDATEKPGLHAFLCSTINKTSMR